MDENVEYSLRRMAVVHFGWQKKKKYILILTFPYMSRKHRENDSVIERKWMVWGPKIFKTSLNTDRLEGGYGD